jgi:hypothetical protein
MAEVQSQLYVTVAEVRNQVYGSILRIMATIARLFGLFPGIVTNMDFIVQPVNAYINHG